MMYKETIIIPNDGKVYLTIVNNHITCIKCKNQNFIDFWHRVDEAFATMLLDEDIYAINLMKDIYVNNNIRAWNTILRFINVIILHQEPHLLKFVA